MNLQIRTMFYLIFIEHSVRKSIRELDLHSGYDNKYEYTVSILESRLLTESLEMSFIISAWFI